MSADSVVQLLTTSGMSTYQAEMLSNHFNLATLDVLFDSSKDKCTEQTCHEKIDNAGPTLTLAIKGDVFRPFALHYKSFSQFFLFFFFFFSSPLNYLYYLTKQFTMMPFIW